MMEAAYRRSRDVILALGDGGANIDLTDDVSYCSVEAISIAI